jgi:hypothetical protein
MADEAQVAQLKKLQADLNAAFDVFYLSAQQDPVSPKAKSAAKQQINTLAQKVSETIQGPAFSLITLALQVG